MPAAVRLDSSPGGAWLRLGSSLRSRPAAATLARARPLMQVLGISRVTDITRLDTLGLPVFASVRPRGGVHRVHAGKGLLPLDAEVGALMEAVEYAAAEPERSRWTARPMTVAALLAQWPAGVGWLDFAPVLGQATAPGDTVTTVACERLGHRGTWPLPAELVFLPWQADPKRAFGWSSTGLASGNTLEEATLHGLFEVLERDALSMHRARDLSQWVTPESLPAAFRRLAAGWRRRGVHLAVRCLPNDFGLPCFEACLHEPGGHHVNLAGGAGLHMHRGVALARAICEAAQSRLSHIHGGREDITHFYAKYGSSQASDRTAREAELLGSVFSTERSIALGQVPQVAARGASLADVLQQLLRRLARAGFGTVFRHHYALALGGLQVVKVIVPRCEQFEPRNRRMGPRLLARVVGRG